MAGRFLLSSPLCIKEAIFVGFNTEIATVVSLLELTKLTSALASSRPSYLERQRPTDLQHPR
ncbi:hypothetical protein CsSME_00036882 [Camellia sinensis var. sinensis]